MIIVILFFIFALAIPLGIAKGISDMKAQKVQREILKKLKSKG